MKTKWVIWGTGGRAVYNLRWLKEIEKYMEEIEIVGFIDNAPDKQGTLFEGSTIYSAEELPFLQYDYIAIWSNFNNEIVDQIVNVLHIPQEKIGNIFADWTNKIRIHNKEDSEEIADFLCQVEESNKLDIYYFKPEAEQLKYWEAFFDKTINLYYVEFFGKKMYLKRNYPIQKIDGREVIPNLWIEQDANSPHLYTDNQVCVKEQDILVDAGACEGNFTLFHIDKVKKAYLVECDMEWMEALKHTFAPYKEKVVFCNKFLGDIDDETHITIDVLIADEELNFLKMDVEGAEINSLNGAEASIRESKDFRCAICAYHKRGDKERIIEMLTQMGVSRTYASKGYMIFLHDQEVLENPELRKGIVRGIKA